jgi:hypothetical protein
MVVVLVLVLAELAVVEVVLCAALGILEPVGPSNTNPSTADTSELSGFYKVHQIKYSNNE